MFFITLFFLELNLDDLILYLMFGIVAICSLLYSTNAVVTNELFPTCIRNIAYSCGQLFSRIGIIIATIFFKIVNFKIFFELFLIIKFLE